MGHNDCRINLQGFKMQNTQSDANATSLICSVFYTGDASPQGAERGAREL